jgi:poly-gamma-glutamate capsule biosynthesis protein CapA/YwtB (metallophosphatase superfamily)
MRYDAEDGAIKMVLTGDSLITRRMSVFKEPDFLALVDILRDADVAITNAEMLFHNFEDAPSVPGTGLQADPKMIEELQWMGINMVCAANNHDYDYGENGLITHLGHLRRSGLVFAGIGETMGEAREPNYLDTKNGRVALISCTSSGPTAQYAGHQWRDGRGRPGANMIRYTTRYTVDEEVFEALKKMRDRLSLAGRNRKAGWEFFDHSWGLAEIPDSDSDFYLPDLQNEWQSVVPSGVRILRGDGFATHLVPDADDIQENIQRISDARKNADWVIVTMHSHERGLTDDDPSDVLVAFAHAAIDAGADVFHGHGPHRDRGIELYKGKPIFYSIGHLIRQSDTVSRIPLESLWRQGCDKWESMPSDFNEQRAKRSDRSHQAIYQDVVAIVEFKSKELSNITLQPIGLGFGRPRYQYGRPMLETGEEAQDVLGLFQRLSKPYGTDIKIDGHVGKVNLAKQKSGSQPGRT